MILHPTQVKVAEDTHRFRVLLCGRRWGKALALDTPILTTDGFKNLIDVQVGDFVFNEKGESTKVLYKSEIYTDRNCYRVVFSDGSVIVADENHDWLVEDKSYRKNLNRSGKVFLKKKTTKELKDNLTYLNKESNFSIPLSSPIQHEEKPLIIEPYFLGLWLGDGCSSNCGITTVDMEIIDYLESYSKRLGLKLRKGGTGTANTFFITGNRGEGNSLQKRLRALDVLYNKHIPEIYLISSEAQRMELLQGLMDSDGYAGLGSNEYSTTSILLANDISKLLASLSIKSTLKEYDAKLYGRVISKKYRVHFNTEKIIFKLTRKRANQNLPKRDWCKRRYIISVDEIDSVPVQCLMVDSPSHLFLAGYNLIFTQNTTLAVEEIKGLALWKSVRIAYIAPTLQQARDIAFETLRTELKPILTYVNESRLELRTKSRDGGESVIFLRSWEAVETLRGQAFNFIVLDEVASMMNFWLNWQEVLRPTLTDFRGEALFISTPKGYNHFYELYCKDKSTVPIPGVEQDDDYKSFHFTSYDNPHVPYDELDKAKTEIPEDRFAQEYMADFRKTAGLVYKDFSRERHVFKDVLYEVLDTSVGVDFGFTNPTAILKVERSTENKFYVTEEWYKTGKTTAEIIEIARSMHGSFYYPDPAEPDRIAEMRKAGVNVREVSKEIEAGINTVAELLKSGRLFIHASCSNLIGEFESYHYPDKKPEKNTPELPVKEYDHALDALRYVLHMKASSVGQTQAHTHYSSAALPTKNNPLPEKRAQVKYAYLGKK